MGDMADMLIDQMFDDPEMEREDDDGPAAWTKACRCCNTGGLHWGQLDGKWRLFGLDNRIHVCAVSPLKS